jgi:hypothetical protein
MLHSRHGILQKKHLTTVITLLLYKSDVFIQIELSLYFSIHAAMSIWKSPLSVCPTPDMTISFLAQ